MRETSPYPSTSHACGLLALVASAVLSGCGGAAAEAKAPREELAPPPTTIEEAQAQIARARAELGSMAAGGPGGAAGASAAGGTSEKDKKTVTSDVAPPDEAPAPRMKAEPADGRRPDVCGSPCRAIVSMRRAVAALCRMTGAEDARCLDAKKTLVESESRVATCACASE